MKTKDKSAPVQVFAGNLIEAEMIKNLLETANIMAFLSDQHMGSLAPWYTSAGGFASVKVVVPAKDSGEAVNLVNDFLMNTSIQNK